MPEAGEAVPPSGTDAFIAGWGKTSEEGASAQFLQEARIPLIDDIECAALYENSFMPETMFCAGFSHGGIDSCQGDSGGPLVVINGNVPTLAGVVSWGVGCGRQGYYGVYAKSSSAIEWIKSAAGEMGHKAFATTPAPTVAAAAEMQQVSQSGIEKFNQANFAQNSFWYLRRRNSILKCENREFKL